jgi:hypothetical protein
MKRSAFLFWGGMLTFIAACAGPGKRYPVSLSYRDGTPSKLEAPRKVEVFSLEDKRDDPELIGRRTRLFGQVDTFRTEILVKEKITNLLIAALRRQGWDAHSAPPGIRPQQITGERVLTGTVKTLWAEATSYLGYTQIDARFTLLAQVLDPTTGEKITVAVDDQSDPKVFFFRPELLQKTLNELVSSSLNRVRLTDGSGVAGFQTPPIRGNRFPIRGASS